MWVRAIARLLPKQGNTRQHRDTPYEQGLNHDPSLQVVQLVLFLDFVFFVLGKLFFCLVILLIFHEWFVG